MNPKQKRRNRNGFTIWVDHFKKEEKKMAKLSKEDLIKKVNEMFGEDATDEQISLLEDISDSMETSNNDELETTKKALTKAQTDLKEFKQKYRERFLGGVDNNPSPQDIKNDVKEDSETEDKKLSYNDLFKTE